MSLRTIPCLNCFQHSSLVNGHFFYGAELRFGSNKILIQFLLIGVEIALTQAGYRGRISSKCNRSGGFDVRISYNHLLASPGYF